MNDKGMSLWDFEKSGRAGFMEEEEGLTYLQEKGEEIRNSSPSTP